MAMETNKSLVKKVFQLWTTGKYAELNELYFPNCLNHQHCHPHYDQTLKGLEIWKKFNQEFRQGFPDIYDTIDDQIAEGDKVATRFTSHGTHKGPWLGITPTNKRVTWTGISINRIENGKIAETWMTWDMHGLLEQLGISAMPMHR